MGSRLAALLFASMVVMVSTRQAPAQALPIIPDPIRVEEIDDWNRRLDLDDERLSALLVIHDRYRERFSRLRDGDIQDFEDALIALVPSFGFDGVDIPERRAVEDAVQQGTRVLDKILRVDRQFFVRMADGLDELRIPILEAIRLEREMVVYERFALLMVREFNRGARVNMATLVRRLELEAEEATAAAAIITPYQRSLIEEGESLHRAVLEAFTAVLDLVDELGLRDMAPEDMMQLAQDEGTIQRLRTLFDEGTRPLQEAAARISSINFETWRKVSKVLTPEHAWTLRDWYFTRAHKQAMKGIKGVRGTFRRALDLDGLDEDQVAALEARRAAFDDRAASLTRELAEAVEASRRYVTFAQVSGEEPRPGQAKIDLLSEKRDDLVETTKRAILDLLGPALAASFQEPSSKESQRRSTTTVMVGGGGGVVVAAEVEPVDVAPPSEDEQSEGPTIPPDEKRFVPDPFGVADRDRMLEALSLLEAVRPVAETIYDTYREDHEAEVQSHAVRLAAITSDPEGSRAAKERQRLEAWGAMLDNLDAIEGRFFDDLALALDGERPRRVLALHGAARHRAVSLNLPDAMGMIWRQRDEVFVDPVTIFLERLTTLSEASQGEMLAVLEDAGGRSNDAVEKLHDAAAEMARLSTLAEILAEGGEDRGASPPDPVRNRMEEAWRGITSASDDLRTVNRDTVEAVLGVLAGEEALALRRHYNRTAFTSVYEDTGAAQRQFDATLALGDLDLVQRAQAIALLGEYRNAYETVCDRMVQLTARDEPDRPAGSFFTPGDIGREIGLERLRFERGELSDRSRLQLRLLLREAQVAAVPGLARSPGTKDGLAEDEEFVEN